MAYVIKIKYENSLRRLTLQKNESGEEDLSFAKLEARIRDLLQLPYSVQLEVTYTDTENDVVTISRDQDLVDALVYQHLNPLRVSVTVVKPKDEPSPQAPKMVESPNVEAPKVEKATATDAEDSLQQLLKKLSSSSSDAVKKVAQSYEPFLESSTQASGLVDNFLRNITTHLAAAVKHGADVTAATKPFRFGASSSITQPSGVRPFYAADTSSRTSDAFNAAAAAAAAVGSEVEVPVNDGGKVEAPVKDGGKVEAPVKDGTKVEAAVKDRAETTDVVHHGVTCDMCGVYPIVGLRWQSNKRYDYDLCQSCFIKHGNKNQYTKIEEPAFSYRFQPKMGAMGPSYRPAGKFHHHGERQFGMRGGPFGFVGRQQCGGPTMGAGHRGKLDARFVCDVTMFDGTEVNPGTRFTKIWRLRNSGSIPWPTQTTLVHVGGDELGEVAVVPLEIPAQGLAPEGEMEVAVDLVAPAKAGRYVSHWRLAAPTGPKFGHRIWVVIQVLPIPVESDIQVPSNMAVDLPAEAVAGSGDAAAVSNLDVVANDSNQEDIPELRKGEDVRLLEPTMSFVNVEVPNAATTESSVGAVPEVQASEVQEKTISSVDEQDEQDLGGGFAMVNVRLGSPFETDFSKSLAADSTPDVEGLITSIQADLDNSTNQLKVDQVEEKSTPVTKASLVEESTQIADEETVTALAEMVEQGPITYPVLSSTPDEGLIAYPVVDVADIAKSEEVHASTSKTLLALLGKLRGMGFINSKLNLELLEANNLDLRRTLDDLCTVEEWDPFMEELEEMGFTDADLNRRLLFKNNGSVKRVVKELVQMYRDM